MFHAHEIICYTIIITVESLNNGHIGTDHFVHYREVVLFQRYCHYIGWCIGKCPLYRGVLYSECPLSEVPLYTITDEARQASDSCRIIHACITHHRLKCWLVRMPYLRAHLLYIVSCVTLNSPTLRLCDQYSHTTRLLARLLDTLRPKRQMQLLARHLVNPQLGNMNPPNVSCDTMYWVMSIYTQMMS